MLPQSMVSALRMKIMQVHRQVKTTASFHLKISKRTHTTGFITYSYHFSLLINGLGSRCEAADVATKVSC